MATGCESAGHGFACSAVSAAAGRDRNQGLSTMRTFVVALLLVGGLAAGSAAQQTPTPAAPPRETNLASGLLPEPHVMSRAVEMLGNTKA